MYVFIYSIYNNTHIYIFVIIYYILYIGVWLTFLLAGAQRLAHHNKLLAANYDIERTLDEIQRLHLDWGRAFCDFTAPHCWRTWANPKEKEKRLVIGYLVLNIGGINHRNFLAFLHLPLFWSNPIQKQTVHSKFENLIKNHYHDI